MKKSCCSGSLSEHRWSIAGAVLLLLGALGLYWLWPEIQRYAKIKRM
jgi:hypothetical protein